MFKWLKSITKEQAGDYFGWFMLTGFIWFPILVGIYSVYNYAPFFWWRMPMLAFVGWIGVVAVAIKISTSFAYARMGAPDYDKIMNEHYKEQQKPAYTWLWRD